jgi:hypothetical protein
MRKFMKIYFLMRGIKGLPCLMFILLFTSQSVWSQNITFTPSHNESAAETHFEILGKVGENYLVYKNISWKNIMQVFDANLKEISNERLKFLPEKMLNASFVTYPKYVVMVYQFKQGGTVFCNALRLDGNGQKLGEIITIDTTKVGLQSGEDIYSSACSEDKKSILIYKMHEKNEQLHVVTKLYDSGLTLLDSTRSVIAFSEKREVYSPFQIANDGTIFFTKETKSEKGENIRQLDVITNSPRSNTFKSRSIRLEDIFIDGVQIKIDNLNNNFIINSFYYPAKRASNIQGVFSAVINRQTDSVNTKINAFDDDLREKMNLGGQSRAAFDNMFLRNIFLKRDGSYVLIAEDYSSQSMNNRNAWNRWDYLYGSPYSFNNDYYYWNSPYYRYNRFNTFNNSNSTRYYYENILIISVDSDLRIKWSNVIQKKQTDDDNENFLSFGTMNTGAEINFLYIEKEKNAQIVSSQSVSVYGKLYRYPTLRNREEGYQFMPRFAKQLGPKQIMMPCEYRGNIRFAKIDF